MGQQKGKIKEINDQMLLMDERVTRIERAMAEMARELDKIAQGSYNTISEALKIKVEERRKAQDEHEQKERQQEKQAVEAVESNRDILNTGHPAV